MDKKEKIALAMKTLLDLEHLLHDLMGEEMRSESTRRLLPSVDSTGVAEGKAIIDRIAAKINTHKKDLTEDVISDFRAKVKVAKTDAARLSAIESDLDKVLTKLAAKDIEEIF